MVRRRPRSRSGSRRVRSYASQRSVRMSSILGTGPTPAPCPCGSECHSCGSRPTRIGPDAVPQVSHAPITSCFTYLEVGEGQAWETAARACHRSSRRERRRRGKWRSGRIVRPPPPATDLRKPRNYAETAGRNRHAEPNDPPGAPKPPPGSARGTVLRAATKRCAKIPLPGSARTRRTRNLCGRTQATRRGGASEAPRPAVRTARGTEAPVGASEGAPTRGRTAGHHAVAGTKTLPSVPLLPKAPKWLTCSTESNGKAVFDSSSPVDRLRSWIF